MKETPVTLKQQLQAMTNDYSQLEALYRIRTGSELVLDPYGSSCSPLPELTLSASIIVASFNSCATLEQCLISLEQSSFNRKYPEQLEVIVADDGSSDGTWEMLEQLHLSLHMKAIRLDNCGPSPARNAALAYASGDIIICCDSDMILAPFSIEELMKRHQILENILLIGFRTDVRAADIPQLQPGVLSKNLPALLPPFQRDMRVDGMWGAGWQIQICAATNHLKHLGHNRSFFWADLPMLIWGHLFSLRRSDFLAIGGFREEFRGGGSEDAFLGAQAIALGNYVIPVYSAAGFHVAHAPRVPGKRNDMRNYSVMQRLFYAPFTPDRTRQPFPKLDAQRAFFEKVPDAFPDRECPGSYLTPFRAALADPYQYGKYLYSLGRYEEAAAAFAKVQQNSEQEGQATFYCAQALRAGDQTDAAIELLREMIKHLPDQVEPLIELALALAAQSQFIEAKQLLEQARALAPTRVPVEYTHGSQMGVTTHELALSFSNQQHYAFAVNEYEGALISNPFDTRSQLERIKLFYKQGKHEKANTAITHYIRLLLSEESQADALCLQQVFSHLLEGKHLEARQLLETMQQTQSEKKHIDQLINYLCTEMRQLHPLPVASSIVEHGSTIPGDYSAEELELLIALTLQAVIKGTEGENKGKSYLIEVGSDVGQATVTMGLTAQGLGSQNAQIIAADGSLEVSRSAMPARVTLALRVAAYHLDGLVVYAPATHYLDDLVVSAPEVGAAPWEHSCQLLLIHSKDDYQSVKEEIERYQTNLVSGGLLVLHHYTDAFPQVQRYVNEVLLPSAEFVPIAQVHGLIAFTRAGSGSPSDL